MDIEKRRKLQNYKVIVSEAIMVLTVIITVVLLSFIVSGYWINENFEVERQGMLQISSVPTGADIEIDGESGWMQRTNSSKVLSSDAHTVKLSKEGYDSWSKTVNISEGLLYRLHYPRLFLQNRKIENVDNLAGVKYATVSPNHNRILLINDTTEWITINVDQDQPETKTIDVSSFVSNTKSEDQTNLIFAGQISEANWDNEASHVLLKIQYDLTTEWVLLDVKNPERTTNLTKIYAMDFERIEIIDNSANNLLAVASQNLYKIEPSRNQISPILVENVMNFDHYRNEVVFISRNTDNNLGYIGLFRLGDDKITQLDSSFKNPDAHITISKFYDERYIAVLDGSMLSLHSYDDFELVSTYDLSFQPSMLKVGHNGEFFFMSQNQQIAILDMESRALIEWRADSNDYGWLDNDMIYVVLDGELIVYDYDGLNRRVLAQNVSESFPVFITRDRWLYYMSDGNLMREWLIPS